MEIQFWEIHPQGDAEVALQVVLVCQQVLAFTAKGFTEYIERLPLPFRPSGLKLSWSCLPTF